MCIFVPPKVEIIVVHIKQQQYNEVFYIEKVQTVPPGMPKLLTTKITPY